MASVPALLILLAACVAQPTSQGDGADRSNMVDAIGSEEASIRGTITAADDRSIRVEEEPADDSGSAKALVRFTSETPILSADGSPATIRELRVGALVSVWFTGPVAESYPVQVAAGAVRIDVPASGEAR